MFWHAYIIDEYKDELTNWYYVAYYDCWRRLVGRQLIINREK